MGIRDEVLSSVGRQYMDTTVYQVSHLDDKEIYRENDQLDVNAVLRPGIDTPCSLRALDDIEMDGSAGKQILLDDEEDKGNFFPTTPAFE